MKFKSIIDTKLFLLDTLQYDLVDTVDENYEPNGEILELFLKHRRQLVDKIKDFRKSQQQKQNWRHYRKKYMTGIKDFHKSTDGKKFHRKLGRFLASRITDENYKPSYDELVECLKSLSSLPTHLLVDLGYYKTTEAQCTYEEMLDEAFPIIYRTLNKMYYADFSIDESDLDMLLRLVDTDETCTALKELHSDLDKDKLYEALMYDELDVSTVELINTIIKR